METEVTLRVSAVFHAISIESKKTWFVQLLCVGEFDKVMFTCS